MNENIEFAQEFNVSTVFKEFDDFVSEHNQAGEAIKKLK